MKRLFVVGLASGFCIASSAFAEEEKSSYYYEDTLIKMQLIPRTPDQMAAFYEARGLSPEAIELIRSTCFLTVGIGNVGKEVVWLEQKNWRFKSHNVPIARFDRSYWKTQWQQINLPAAKQATFAWTQLPEVRDLMPNEPVGGNVVLPIVEEPFTLEAHFRLGADKRGEEMTVVMNNIRCAKDPLPPPVETGEPGMSPDGTPLPLSESVPVPMTAPVAPVPPVSKQVPTPNNVIRR